MAEQKPETITETKPETIIETKTDEPKTKIGRPAKSTDEYKLKSKQQNDAIDNICKSFELLTRGQKKNVINKLIQLI